MLIGVGVAGTILPLWEYRKLLRYLWHAEFAAIAGIEDTPAPTLVPAMALIILLIGLFAFFAVLLRF
jgi:putative membrane protein